MHLAAMLGRTTALTLLLQAHAEINARNSYQQTALHLAAERGHDKVLSILLQHGADFRVLDSLNRSILQYAISEKHESTIHIILAEDIDVDVLDFHNSSALLLDFQPQAKLTDWCKIRPSKLSKFVHLGMVSTCPTFRLPRSVGSQSPST